MDHRSIALLGLLTICTYGSWYYSFGVLLDPIRLDTSWSEAALAASFSAGTTLVGLGAIAGGRLLDRLGHRMVFMLGGAVGGSSLVLASWTTGPWTFLASTAVALGVTGALGFYPITMTTAVRLNPNDSGRAILVLTIWGAFASAVFLPLTSWLEHLFGWRSTVRILAALLLGAFWAAAVALPSAGETERAHKPVRAVLADVVSTPAGRWFAATSGLAGIAMATILVYQVPVMTAAGLPAGTAAAVAGLRGAAQTAGRIPIGPIMRRLGTDRAMALAFAAVAGGGVLLALSGTLPVAIAFAITAGFGIGAFSPLQGIKAEELFDRDALGTTMGFFGSLLVLCGSAGPFVAGVLSDRTGDRWWASVITVIAALGALASVLRLSRLQPND